MSYIEKAIKEAKFEMTDEEMDEFLEAVDENGKESTISKEEFIWWLKGFVEGKRKLSENDLKLLKQKLEVI
jgi:hypothetical protein